MRSGITELLRNVPADLRRNGRSGQSGFVSKVFPELCIGEIAKQIGCTKSYLSKVLRGQKNGSIRILSLCAKALNVSVDEFLALQRHARVIEKHKRKAA